jgi:hypothetical protein
VLADVSFIHPLAVSFPRSAASAPGHAAALQDGDKRRDCYADHACSGYAFRAISFETLGWFSLGTMQFLYKATHARGCSLLRQRVPPAVSGAVQTPAPHAYGRCGPPHRFQGFRLDPLCTPCLFCADGLCSAAPEAALSSCHGFLPAFPLCSMLSLWFSWELTGCRSLVLAVLLALLFPAEPWYLPCLVPVCYIDEARTRKAKLSCGTSSMRAGRK